jgi:cytochrome c biogenesis protein ResB
VKRFIAWITSMRLAIGLIAYLAIACVLATLMPRYFERFFGSVWFVFPAFLFFANLSACTVTRLLRGLQKRGGRRHGPDILHLGLMVLVIGSLWSFSGHRQGAVSLVPVDSVSLPDGSVLFLDDFRFERYPDGRPRDWVSVVSVVKDGEPILDGIEIRVNDPLRYGGWSYYQASFEESSTASGTGYASGIEAVSDPGYPLVLVALALVAIGTTWTFAQKLKEGV